MSRKSTPKADKKRSFKVRGTAEDSKSDGVPKLIYGDKNNFAKYRKLLSTKSLQDYHDLGRLITTEKYYEPPPVPPPDLSQFEQVRAGPESSASSSAGSRTTRSSNPDDEHHRELSSVEKAVRDAIIMGYNEEVKARVRHILRMKEARTSFFAFILSTLSADSEDALKQDDEYAVYTADNDPLALWKAVIKHHQSGTTHQCEAVQKSEIRNQYYRMQQGAHESLISFKERFEDKRIALEMSSGAEVEEANAAMDFLSALDSHRFAEFKADLQNGMTMGDKEPPKTVTEVYRMVQQYIVPRAYGGNKSTSAGTVFVTTEKGGGKRGQQKPGKGGDKPKKDLSHITCFNCQEQGHYASDCPAKSDEEEDVNNDDSDSYPHDCITQQAYVATYEDKFKRGAVIIDNASDVCAVRKELLSNVRRAQTRTAISTLAGTEMELELDGDLEGFFRVKSSSKLRVSILSFAQVEDVFSITYNQRESMVVHLPERDVIFHRQGRLYVADMSDWLDRPSTSLVTTSAEKESGYSRKEVERAREARQLIENAGHISQRDALNMVRGSNIQGISVTADDVMRCFDIYGQSAPYVQGRTTVRKPVRLAVDKNLKEEHKPAQDLHCDVMWVNEQIYFISLSANLGLLLCSSIPTTHTSELGLALQGHVNVLKSHGFTVATVYMDAQRGVTSLKGQIIGAVIDESGAGDHTPIMDGKIRRAKEMIRSVISGLPWTCPMQMRPDAVAYTVTRHNIRKSSCNGTGVAPRVALTGVKPMYKKELSIAFGDYCECRDPAAKSNDASAKRTNTCIALYPVGNSTGSWVFMNLDTKRRVRRSQWKKMVTTQVIIDRLNAMCEEEKNRGTPKKLPRVLQQEQMEDVERSVRDDECPRRPEVRQEPGVDEELDATESEEVNNDVDDVNDEQNDQILSEDGDDQLDASPSSDRGDEAPGTADMCDSNTETSDRGDDDDDESVINADEHDEQVPMQQEEKRRPIPRHSTRQRKAPKRYQLYTCLHIYAQKAEKMFGKDATNAMINEIKQLLKEKKAIHPVYANSLSKRQLKKRIRSLMFLKPKFDAMGRFEKIKARLVANGAQQDRNLFDDLSSPTAATMSVFIILAIAATERRKTATIDVTGAYLNADMTGETVVMELDALVTRIVTKVAPDAKQYMDERGRMLVVLDKALYGCVQSAKLWYENVCKFLQSIGYVANDVDPCIMNKMVNDKQCTIALFVDDILITCEDEAGIDQLIESLRSEYGDITVHRDPVDLSYIGMHLHTEGNKIKVSQLAYITELLTKYEITGVAASPATGTLFEDDGSHALLSDKEKALFHTQVAQLLYLSTRTRPDILLAVSYLTTRVRAPNDLDKRKLSRVFKYLNGTKDQAIVLGGSSDLAVRAHIDAAFALHGDGKSHSGLVIKIGGSTIMCKSSKQKIVTKDSTEAELVALSDMMVLVLKAHEFMQSQGRGKKAPVLYQDNMSTISLVTKGGGKYRTKHMRVRREVVRECASNGDIRVVYKPTGQMLADSLTKPLQGTLLRGMTQGIVCNYHRCVTGVR
jgi:hypothetical protein